MMGVGRLACRFPIWAVAETSVCLGFAMLWGYAQAVEAVAPVYRRRGRGGRRRVGARSLPE